MQYEAVTDDVSAIPDSKTAHRVEQPTALRNEQLVRLRRRNLILISIHLFIWGSTVIYVTFQLFKPNSKETFRNLLTVFVGFLIFVWGFISVYRFSRTGISFFFWFLIIDLVVGWVEILWISFHEIRMVPKIETEHIVAGVIVSIIFGAYFILNFFLLRAARTLYHEIKSFKQATSVQV